MTQIVVERSNGWLIIGDSNGNRMQYLYYSKRERLRKFKEEFGHKHKRIELFDFTKKR